MEVSPLYDLTPPRGKWSKLSPAATLLREPFARTFQGSKNLTPAKSKSCIGRLGVMRQGVRGAFDTAT